MGAKFGIYSDDFETRMIQETKRYYEIAADKWIIQKSTPEYLQQVEQVQQLEQQRINLYLHPSTSEAKVFRTLRETLLKNPQVKILDEKDSGLIQMLTEEASEDLARLYRLYKEVDNGIPPIAQSFKAYVCSLGY